MASSEGQTELLSGWSCVVHQPSEDPEPSELPSTVDIAAFSAGLGVEPASSSANGNACTASESDSDSESASHGSGSGSGSGSASDSSDSDSSSTSTTSRSRSPSPAPKFSVTSQAHDQLRLTIATVRKTTTSELPPPPAGDAEKTHTPTAKERRCTSSESCDSSDSDSSDSTPTPPAAPQPEAKAAKSAPVKSVVSTSAPASTAHHASADSSKESKVGSAPPPSRSTRLRRLGPAPPPIGEQRRQERRSARRLEHAAKEKDKEVSPRVLRERARLKRKKMAALPTARSSPRSSSDSQDSDADSVMLSACSLQEIRQEDLAAILPDQQECDAFDAFEENAKNSPAAGDASASDIELPQQAVNAIIQRTTESYSESESHPPPNTNLFANSLIQQFHIVNSGQDNTKNGVKHPVKSGETDKKKRGRPKKVVKKAQPLEYCGDPNVSPDSGIQNSPDHVSSPECSPLPIKSKFENKSKCVKKEPLAKMTVTSNRFDRILYGHSDRVLYPPRRKVGRPVSKKGPGRPPKNKSCENKPKSPKAVEAKVVKTVGKKKEVLQTNNQPGVGTIEKSKEKEKSTHLNEICERISKRLEEKKPVKPKVALPTNSKSSKNKYLTLKNAKLMHSKHKHRKHKKCKFKILKPLSSPQPADPKLTADIEKLVNEFFRLCSISPMVAKAKETLPDVGKVLKKVSKKRKVSDYNERKKKKVIAETSPNEQRLPLKKRHYHLTSTNSVSENKEKEKNEEVVPEEKKDEVEVVSTDIDVAFSNNNEYDLKTSHIDEAIEACITKYTGTTPLKQDKLESPEGDASEEKPMTTPKKRHRLEQFSPELPVEEEQPGLETVVNEIKMRRNLNASGKKTCDLIATMKKKTKLDELTSNLSSKLVEAEEAKRRKDLKEDVKSPICKKTKSVETKELIVVVEEDKPTGIFLPTVDLEALEPIKPSKEPEPTKESKQEAVVNPVRTVNIKEVKRKVRKRRAINRTGFPTVKKKKKKVVPAVVTPVAKVVCDRVPKEGEEYLSFVERTEMPKPDDIEEDDELSGMKWEAMSECDSLPQEDRIDFDIKAERNSLKSRNESPMTTSSMEDMSLHERLAKLRQPKKFDKKLKHLRDLSPASRESSASGDDSKRTKKHPRWRKRYLAAGLFSDYYKEDEAKRQDVPKKLQYIPDEHTYGLLPAPYHCGKYLRCRKIPFQLPYDLWYQHTHSQLPGRDIVPSWNYRKIRSNVYNVKNTLNACEPQACNCSPTANCGDDCINRLVLAECPASHKCNNQRIQRHEWAPGLDKFMTESKGWGIKTNEPIKSGEFILEYVGEVVSDQEFKERMATRYVHDTHHYCLHLDGGLVIDGHRMGGDGRFVNHSCEPNCEIQKWSVNGQFRMALFSLCDIKAGEELTYDYNFSLFNPADGQECKCGSDDCRGVIGGKSQRVRQSQAQAMQQAQSTARVGRPRKTQAKKAAQGAKVPNQTTQQANTTVMPPVKISSAQQVFIKEHHCFLLRNLKRIKKLRDRSGGSNGSVPRAQTSTPTNPSNQSAVFLSQLNALRQPRNMITRRVAQAEDDPELKKTVRLANLLRNIFKILIDVKDEKNEKLSTPFMLLPSKRKQPDYYQKITDPIDFTTIEQAITSGTYKTFESFETDLNRLFNNAVKFYGRSDNLGIASARLKKVYNDTKGSSMAEIQKVLGVKSPTKFMSHKKKAEEEEDIIRCICGMYKDEGLMIQCERCLVWQHCECVKADDNAASYHCEQCVPRVVEYEIALDEYTEHNHRYYMTLMRDDLQLRQGDTVYVLRDIAIPGTEKKHTYDTIGEVKYSDLDIFRIERLWKDSKTGQRFAYGHHYLRPHETYHEPSRKFFSNEVMRVPLYEAVPVELIISHCWVMDLNTFCKGRPIGAPEEHIYICEYRVDKNARLFSKVSKSKFPICCKSYAFERFAERIKVSRTYTPHDLDPAFLKQRGRKPNDVEEVKVVETPVPVVVQPVIKTAADKKARVNAILLKLLSKYPSKHPLDVTYLLEGGRRRKNREEKK